MNIFAVSVDVVHCARALDTRRLNKMVTETAQIIATARHFNGLRSPYAPAYVHHPVCKWAASEVNLSWTCRLLLALGDEWLRRGGDPHRAIAKMGRVARTHTSYSRPNPYNFVNCARNAERGFDFTHIRDVHEAYRQYLNARWLAEIEGGYVPQWPVLPSWVGGQVKAAYRAAKSQKAHPNERRERQAIEV